MTELPPRDLLEKTLHESIRRARERLAIAEQQNAPEARTRVTGPALPRRIPKKGLKG
jgi:hypothetical protein